LCRQGPAIAPTKPKRADKSSKVATGDTPAVSKRVTVLPRDVAIVGVLLTGVVLLFYACHCIWVSAEMYSAPSIVLHTRNPDSSKRTLDDFREAYAWLRRAATPCCVLQPCDLCSLATLGSARCACSSESRWSCTFCTMRKTLVCNQWT
jgi:hypothetical protein